mgnify:CR=1 FL=1
MAKLNQLLAIEKAVKSKREDEFTRLYQDVQKGDLTSGFVKTYQAKDETGDQQAGAVEEGADSRRRDVPGGEGRPDRHP